MYFRVHLTNFDYYLEPYFETLDAAVTAGRQRGFEFAVYTNYGDLIGSASGVNLSWAPAATPEPSRSLDA